MINWLYRLKYYFTQGMFVLQLFSFATLVFGLSKYFGLPRWVAYALVFLGFIMVILAGWVIVEKLRGPQNDERESLKRSDYHKERLEEQRMIKELHEAQFGKSKRTSSGVYQC